MEGRTGHKKGLWTAEEDRILTEYIKVHGKGKWNWVAKMTGLKRSGRSCRLRWINYLSPTVKRGGFSEEEDDLIIRLHNLLGNRWSLISGRVPGRTDNQVKNHWNTHLSKKYNTVKKIKVNFGASSGTMSSVKGKGFSVPMVMDKNSKPLSDDNIGETCQNQITIGETCQNEITIGLFGVEEPIMINEGCKTSFQFQFPIDDPNLDTPSLMELLDQYAPDFVL